VFGTSPLLDRGHDQPCTCAAGARAREHEQAPEGVLHKLWRQRDRGFETFALVVDSSRKAVPATVTALGPSFAPSPVQTPVPLRRVVAA